MPLTADDLNRATLARQLLLAREPVTVPEAVRRIGAVQAQEPPSPYVALWNRVDGFDPADLDAAFADGTVVRATLMRMTFHAVHADDWAPFHRAVTDPLRRSRLGDRRFLPAGLTIPEANALRDVMLEFADEPRTQDEIVAFLTDHLDDPDRANAAWWALRTFAPLRYVPTGPPWSYDPRRRTLHALATTAPDAMPPGDDPAVVHLVRRYLEAFGPASEADFGQFTMLRRPFSGPALAALRDELVELEGPNGTRLFDLFRGPHFTLLGLGERCAPVLRAVDSDIVQPSLVGPGGLLDDGGHVAHAYGDDALVLVRPDGYVGLIADPTDPDAVGGYLRSL